MRYTKGDNTRIIIEEKKMEFYKEWFEYLEDRGYYDSDISLFEEVETKEGVKNG